MPHTHHTHTPYTKYTPHYCTHIYHTHNHTHTTYSPHYCTHIHHTPTPTHTHTHTHTHHRDNTQRHTVTAQLPSSLSALSHTVTSRLVHSSPKRTQNTLLRVGVQCWAPWQRPESPSCGGRSQGLARPGCTDTRAQHSTRASSLSQGLRPHFPSVAPAHCDVRVLLCSPGWEGMRPPASLPWVCGITPAQSDL